jgi:hypothetical protein
MSECHHGGTKGGTKVGKEWEGESSDHRDEDIMISLVASKALRGCCGRIKFQRRWVKERKGAAKTILSLPSTLIYGTHK